MGKAKTKTKAKAKTKTKTKAVVPPRKAKNTRLKGSAKTKAAKKAPKKAPPRRLRARPGTMGFLLDQLDEAYPVPVELGRASRPYSWEDNASPTELVVQINDQTAHTGPADIGYLLSYWQNQSGGSGWGWKLGFADLREVIDFLCVVDGGMACDDEPMLDYDADDDESDDEGLRITPWIRSLTALRVQALRSRNLQPLIETFNKGWGGIESIE